MTPRPIRLGIGALASLSALLLCPQLIACERHELSPIVQERSQSAVGDEHFDAVASLRQLARADTASEQLSNLDEDEASGLDNIESTGQRRRLSWWNIALFFANHCPPGPLHHMCANSDSSGSSGSSVSGGSVSGGSGGGSVSGISSGNWYNDDYVDDGWGSGASAASTGDSGASGADSGAGSQGAILSAGDKGFWVLLVVAAATATAVAAIVIGSRRKEPEKKHPLQGVLQKRMKIFGSMTDNCFADRSFCGGTADIDAGTEMTPEMTPTDYRNMV